MKQTPAVRTAIALSIVAIAVHYVVPIGEARSTVYAVISQIAALAIAAVAFGRPRAVRGPLLCLAGGMQLLVGGDWIWTYYEVILHRAAPFPSIADLLYLAGFPVQLAGLWWMLRRRNPGRDGPAVLDALVLAAGAAALSWTFIIRAIALEESVGFAERAISVAYPVIDVMLLGMVARMLLSRGRRHAAFGWFVVALVTALAADVVYSVQSAHDAYVSGSWVDLGWLSSYCAWAIGAVHPTSARLADPIGAVEVDRVGPMRVASLIVGATTPSVCLLAWMHVADAADIAVVVVASCAAFVFVITRLLGVFRSLDRTADELRRANRERRQLMADVLGAAERERIRVAGSLHDGPLQGLAAVRMDLQIGSMAAVDGDLDEVREVLDRASIALSAEVGAIRSMMSSLRPPVLDERGLGQAIEDHLRVVAGRRALDVDSTCRVEEPLDPDTETLLFRVAQEAVSNAVRHGGPTRLDVGLVVCDGLAHLRVADDGRGFVPRATAALMVDGHFGIAGMIERVEMAGGTFQLTSRPGDGTVVTVELPTAAPGPIDPSGQAQRLVNAEPAERR